MSKEIETYLAGIFSPVTGNKRYFKVSNSDQKVWYIPDRNSSIALELYQPSSFKGKLLKTTFPLLKPVLFFRSVLGIVALPIRINPRFYDLMCRLFKTDKIDISIFGGTPSAHQKVAVQISTGNRILGYCKASENIEISALFVHEEAMLKELRSFGITEIPECLYCGNGIDGENLFVQTTTKTRRSKVCHKLSAIHWEFLNKLYLKTKRKLPFEQTDYYQSLEFLKHNLNYLLGFNSNAVELAIKKVEKHYCNRLVEFSVFQADFTPWNTYVEKGILFVFDWEYSKRTFPPFLDAFHFFTQACIFEGHCSESEIFKAYKSGKNQFRIFVEDPDIMYMSYLIYVISFYTNREKGIYNTCINNNIHTWLKLLHFLHNESIAYK